MSWELLSLATASKLAKAIGLGFKAKSIRDRLRLEQDCDELVNLFELDCCETVREFIDKFERLPASAKTKFLKCYPDIFEYLEHAENNSGIPFTFR
jgi:hypothetical protein